MGAIILAAAALLMQAEPAAAPDSRVQQISYASDQVVTLADRNRWRLALVGDPRQLQGVGRGGLFAELCANGRVDELERLRLRLNDRLARSLECDGGGAKDHEAERR